MLTFLTQAPYWDWSMPGPWHMGWGGGFWWMFPMLMFVFMIALCVFMMRGHWHSHHHNRSALELLAERFAKGEIGKDEYEQKRSVIGRRT